MFFSCIFVKVLSSSLLNVFNAKTLLVKRKDGKGITGNYLCDITVSSKIVGYDYDNYDDDDGDAVDDNVDT